MFVILYIWTTVAISCASSCNYTQAEAKDWRPLGEYVNIAACERSREKLGIATEARSRCVPKY